MIKVQCEKNDYKKCSRKNYIFVFIFILLILLIGIGFVFSTKDPISKHLNMGQKYLAECEYEQAIVEYTKVIEIEPMNVEAYLGIIEAYLCMGEFDLALEYAKRGYEITGDLQLKDKIEMIKSNNIVSSNGWVLKKCVYNGSNELIGYILYDYGKQGRVINATAYTMDNIYIDSVEYQYDEKDNVILREAIGFDESIIIYTLEMDYDDMGNMILAKYYEQDGSFLYHYVYEFDEEGKSTGIKSYDESGNIILYEVHEHDVNEQRRIRKTYNALGNMVNYYEDLFDLEGRTIRTNFYYDNILQNYIIFIYDEEGNQIETQYYNADGTLKREIDGNNR